MMHTLVTRARPALRHLVRCTIRAYQTAPAGKDGLPRRSLLYVPTSNPRMLTKSLAAQADTIIYDLEDSVAAPEKERARGLLDGFLRQGELPSAEIAVRVNDMSTPTARSDIEVALSHPPVQTIVLPKVHSPYTLALFSDMAHSLAPGRQVNIVASIESARALWAVGEIASWSASPARSGGEERRHRVCALLFAAEDYCADSGVIRTPRRTELLYPRARMATAAKAFGLEAIDMVCVDYKDMEVLEAEAQEARHMGYTGKQAIHPSQVPLLNRTFVPTAAEVHRAALILHGMAASHGAKGAGAFGLEVGGRTEMIDAPMVKQAERVVWLAREAGLEVPVVGGEGRVVEGRG